MNNITMVTRCAEFYLELGVLILLLSRRNKLVIYYSFDGAPPQRLSNQKRVGVIGLMNLYA